MAGKGASGAYIRWRKPSGRCFVTALSSAVLEWLLIVMLLVNGVFAYLITRFARYCGLPIPCLLCSRLDHVFGTRRMGSYWDLMCRSHKSEISSLVLCARHDRLVDVHGVCEDCLFSFATKDKSNSETYRLLVGKIGLDSDDEVDDSPLMGDQKHLSRGAKVCCCCNELWSSRSHAEALLRTKSVDADAQLPRELRLNWNGMKKENKRPNFIASISAVHESFEDCSPHFGYSELKLNSDTESEDQTFDTEPNVVVPEPYHLQRHLAVDLLQTETEVSKLVEASVQEKPINSDVSSQSQSDLINTHDAVSEESLAPDASLLEPLNLIDDWMKPHDTSLEPPNLIDHEPSHSDLTESHEPPSALPATVGHGLEELNWQDIDLKTESSPSSDSIRPNNVPESLNAADIHVDPSKVVPVEVVQMPVTENVERVNEAEKEHTTTDVLPDSKINSDASNGGAQPTNSLELGDAYKLAVSSRGRQLSGKTLDTLIVVDIQVDPSKVDDAVVPAEVEKMPVIENVERVNEAEKDHTTTDVLPDYKINSDARDGGAQPANSLELGDAYKLAVSSRGRQLSGKTLEQLLGKDSTRVSEDLKLLLAQLSVARGLELPLAGMISPRVSANLEDSRALDALASIGIQILHKRISLERNDSRSSLERNESGFESLDLSTVGEIDGESALDRLKRQVEQDKKLMSALCKELEEERNASAVAANQALAMITRLQEEKAAMQMEALHDIRMMEEQAEYDVEALERANDLLAEKEKEIQDLEAEIDYYRINYHGNEEEELVSDPHSRSSPKSSWLGFDDERSYISRRLGSLETKLQLFSNTGIHQDLQNGDCLDLEGAEQAGSEHESDKDGRRPPVRRAYSLKTPKSMLRGSSVHTEAADMVTLGYEVSTLNERLQALEADRNFLEHAINSLRGGEDGVRFIQEIATHLRELRRVGIKRQQSCLSRSIEEYEAPNTQGTSANSS